MGAGAEGVVGHAIGLRELLVQQIRSVGVEPP